MFCFVAMETKSDLGTEDYYVPPDAITRRPAIRRHGISCENGTEKREPLQDNKHDVAQYKDSAFYSEYSASTKL